MQNLSLFVKPYLSLPTKELIAKVKELGFSKIEYPVRNDHFINCGNCKKELPLIKEKFLKEGIEITTVAGSIDKRIFVAMNKANIPFLRIMLPMKKGENFKKANKRFVKELRKCARYGKKYNVITMIQPHNGKYIANLSELERLLKKVNSRYVKAIWDIGHSGLSGEIPEKCVDEIFDRLGMVNLKSAFYTKIDFEDGSCKYKPYYTVGKKSPLNWSECVKILEKKGYDGLYCLHAEYTDPAEIDKFTQAHNTDAFLKEDIKYAFDVMQLT